MICRQGEATVPPPAGPSLEQNKPRPEHQRSITLPKNFARVESRAESLDSPQDGQGIERWGDGSVFTGSFKDGRSSGTGPLENRWRTCPYPSLYGAGNTVMASLCGAKAACTRHGKVARISSILQHLDVTPGPFALCTLGLAREAS